MENFILKYDLTMQVSKTFENPNMPDAGSMYHFAILLECGPTDEYGRRFPRTMKTYYSMGVWHARRLENVDIVIPPRPKLADILDCLASDSLMVQDASFEEWASDLGYSDDSRSAFKTYDTIKKQSYDLFHLLGSDAFQELLNLEVE